MKTILFVMNKKILITGGAGNLGSSLAVRLIQNPKNFVFIVDDLSTGSTTKLPSTQYANWVFKQASVNRLQDIRPIMEQEQFDYVFHYAAVVGVARTLEHPKKVLEDIDGIKNILDLSVQTDVKRVFYSSSSEVYGEPVELPLHEERSPLNSKLPYAIVKNVGEGYFRTYKKEYDLCYTIFRFFNTYGPQQSSDFVVTKFIAQAQAGQDITINGSGLQTRTFCYVDDNLDIIEKILEKDLCKNDLINIGSADEITILDLAKRIIKLTNSTSKIVHLPALKEGDMTRRQPDITKMLDILGRDLVGLDEGLLKTIEQMAIIGVVV